jgi:hypothetical protein
MSAPLRQRKLHSKIEQLMVEWDFLADAYHQQHKI